MTVIEGTKVQHIKYIKNDIKDAIRNNDKIEENLHMVICISNPVQYESRYILARKFIKRIEEEEKNVILYIVELVYDLANKKQDFVVTDSNNKRHLQLRTVIPLWHKENLLNIGIRKLLPFDWKCVCWADADIIFDNPHFAIDTLKILNGTRDIVQNFSHCVDMDENENAMSIFSGFGYQYMHNKPYKSDGNPNNQFHCGFVWSCTRKAYEQMGGLFDTALLGSGDHHMALCWINNGINSINTSASDGYKQSILEYEERCKGLTVGYVPGVIKHEYHGKKQKRFYNSRWKILIDNCYNQNEHVCYNKDGLLIPTVKCPKKMLDEIYTYFESRQEDEQEKEKVVKTPGLIIMYEYSS